MTVKVEFKGNSVKFTFGDKVVAFTSKDNITGHDDIVVEQFAIALLAKGDPDKSEELNEKLEKL